MLTVPEAARRTGRNPETIRRWIREGKLAAHKVGTQHLIEPGDLAAAIGGEGHRVGEAAAVYDAHEGARDRGEAFPNQWLPAIVGRLVRAADPVQIVLFGKRASGTGSTDADYELLVILDQVLDQKAATIALRGSFDDIPVGAAIFVESVTQAAQGRRGVSSRARDEGRTVYARDAIPPASILQRLIESGRISPPANPDTSVLPPTWPATSGISATESLLAERRSDPR